MYPFFFATAFCYWCNTRIFLSIGNVLGLNPSRLKKPAGSGSLKNKSHLGLNELNALDLLSPPCGNGLALLDKVLATCSINESSPNAHALFVASRIA